MDSDSDESYDSSSDSGSTDSSSESANEPATSLSPKTTDLGKRVVFMGNDKKQKYGILRFMGETEFAEGVWCGLELDQPTGKNNGSVHGIRYFTCDPSFGVFVPISKLELDVSGAGTSRRSRSSRPSSQPSSRAASVERRAEPLSVPHKSTMKSSSITVLTVNKIGGLSSIHQDIANRLSQQPLRRSSQPMNNIGSGGGGGGGNSRRQPMKAFAAATKSFGREAKAKEQKKLPPFRSGGMYKAASTENIRGLKDKEKTKSGQQKLSQGMPAKKSSSERDLRNAGKSTKPSSNPVTSHSVPSKAKWKQMRTKSSSDVLEFLAVDPAPSPAPVPAAPPPAITTTSTSNSNSTTSSTSHTSLENYPWPRTSTPGNRDDLTPDGCSSPEESEERLGQHVIDGTTAPNSSSTVNNGFIEVPEGPAAAVTSAPPTITTVECEGGKDDGLANHVTRFTAQVSSSPSLGHQTVPSPPPPTSNNGHAHAHKHYKNRPSGTATLDHPLTSSLLAQGESLLKQLLGSEKSLAGVSAEDVLKLFDQQQKQWHSLVVKLKCQLEEEQSKSQKLQEELNRLNLKAPKHGTKVTAESPPEISNWHKERNRKAKVNPPSS